MANNHFTADGYLRLTGAPHRTDLDGVQTYVFEGELVSDQPYKGGVHPLMLAGKPAEIVIEALKRTGGRPVYATVSGKLYSWPERHFIEVKYVMLHEAPTPHVPPLEGGLVPGREAGNGAGRKAG